MGKENTEIFLPIKYSEYKENKVKLLESNLSVVKMIERLNKIYELREVKSEQRSLLIKETKEFKKEFNKLKTHLPSGKEIKIANSNTKKDVIDPKKITVNINENSSLDRELERIRNKIKSLNI